jgi:hypothetical protein
MASSPPIQLAISPHIAENILILDFSKQSGGSIYVTWLKLLSGAVAA